jgi:hypothetical protein
MRRHGGDAPPTLAELTAGSPLMAGARSVSVASPRYRNMFGEAAAGETFQGYGLSDSEIDKTTDLLKALAFQMSRTFPWRSKLAGARREDENPNLPAGYTYLAQLIAHDLTFVDTVFPQLLERTPQAQNFRVARLELDTLYGGGAIERPACYAAPAAPEQRRFLLRLGYFRDRADPRSLPAQEQRKRARDLPRLSCSFLDEGRLGLTDVAIADPRNDDQPIVAQIFVLFAMLHNAVCRRLLSPGEGTSLLRGDDLFLAARKVVTHVYQEIIAKDFLARLLNKSVYRRYASHQGALLDSAEDGRMPIEFSHAAFRFGHAMVRSGYQFNASVDSFFNLPDTLRENSLNKPGRMPLPAIWIIQWSHFFDVSGRAVNLSRRLAPSMAQSLFDDALFGDDTPAHQDDTLAYRDLVRGAPGMRSLSSLTEKLRPHFPRLPALLENPDILRKAINDWLDSSQPIENLYGKKVPSLTSEDRRLLSEDPPLLFFILLEAANTEDGERLGFLGSIIVAEVIFAALRDSPVRLAATALAARVFNSNVPQSMSDLVEFLNSEYKFGPTDVPFL